MRLVSNRAGALILLAMFAVPSSGTWLRRTAGAPCAGSGALDGCVLVVILWALSTSSDK